MEKSSWINTMKIVIGVFIVTLLTFLSYKIGEYIDANNSLIGSILWFPLVIIVCIIYLIFIKIKYKNIKSYEMVKTYQVFNFMEIFFYLALLIGAGTYFAIAVLSDTANIGDYFKEMAIFLTTLIFLTILGLFIASKVVTRKGGIVGLYIVGVTLCLTINILVSCNVINTRWLYYLLIAIGTAMMIISIILLHNLLKKVFNFVLKQNSNVMHLIEIRNFCWACLISSSILEIVIIVFHFTNIDLPKTTNLLLFLPVIFLFVALWISLMQPIDKHYLKLLDLYIKGIDDSNVSEKVRLNLIRKFAHTTRRVWVKIACLFVKPFVYTKVKNKQNVNLNDGPVIFVANHYEIYGPIVAALYIPFRTRFWIVNGMLSLDLIEDHIKPGADKILKHLPEKWRRNLVKRFSKTIIKCLNEFDPIPVYKESIRDLIRTMNASVEALLGGDNILLFPEDSRKYKDGEIDKFYTGFATLGEMYYKKSGKEVTFYPLYISKVKKTMTFGNGITFNKKNDSFLEKQRIAQDLYSEMTRLMENENSSTKAKK